jgi:protease I
MSNELNGKRIAFLATDGVEQVELIEPLRAVTDAGGGAEIISLREGEFQGFDHLDKGQRFRADRSVHDAHADEYDGLVLPGGVANPDALRLDPDAVAFVRAFFEQHKPVGVICHGPWMLIDAGVARDRTLTSWPSLRADLSNAGAHWVDEQVVVDQGLVTSRKPDDLPAFCAKIIEEFHEGAHEGQRPTAAQMH